MNYVSRYHFSINVVDTTIIPKETHKCIEGKNINNGDVSKSFQTGNKVDKCIDVREEHVKIESNSKVYSSRKLSSWLRLRLRTKSVSSHSSTSNAVTQHCSKVYTQIPSHQNSPKLEGKNTEQVTKHKAKFNEMKECTEINQIPHVTCSTTVSTTDLKQDLAMPNSPSPVNFIMESSKSSTSSSCETIKERLHLQLNKIKTDNLISKSDFWKNPRNLIQGELENTPNSNHIHTYDDDNTSSYNCKLLSLPGEKPAVDYDRTTGNKECRIQNMSGDLTNDLLKHSKRCIKSQKHSSHNHFHHHPSRHAMTSNKATSTMLSPETKRNYLGEGTTTSAMESKRRDKKLKAPLVLYSKSMSGAKLNSLRDEERKLEHKVKIKNPNSAIYTASEYKMNLYTIPPPNYSHDPNRSIEKLV